MNRKSNGKWISLILAAVLVLSLTACRGKTAAEQEKQEPAVQEQTQDAEQGSLQETEEAQTGSDAENATVLVVYFSATETTEGVAQKIAAVTGADLYEITAAQEYTSDDLNWHDNSSRTTLEQNDKSARPQIGSDPVSLEGYATVYIGYPIWWGEEPRIMDTFVESCDFEGITVIPFCTSGGSGIGRSGKNLEEIAGSGFWLEGQRFGANVSEKELEDWISAME
ncbi:MAG: flavodoxin [Clostridia bacterium]|nr:flavodoxin [Clostridia bacterium]